MHRTNACTIGQLGKATATKAETIRYYERIGLLPAPKRTAGNYRSYADEHFARLAFIRRSRELGFSIDEVRDLLQLAAQQENSCADVDQIAARHLAEIDRKIRLLKQLRDQLRKTLAACGGGRIAECRVVEALSSDGTATRKKQRRRRA